ncbi:MAG TPA: POTRA domain-containing protein, partial [Blastocatellia bacterium]|nr:POTRA domain-containing protein [Blastocatellia bacterium]
MLTMIFTASLVLNAVAAVSTIAQQNVISPLAPVFSSPPQARQFRLGKLTFAGNTHTKEYVIRRMIPLSEGDIFNQSLWEFGLEQINLSGLFEPVERNDVVMNPDDARGIVDIELRLRERDHQRVDMSGGGGTTGGSSISMDYANSNLTGRGDRLAGRLRLGTRERGGGATFSTMSYGKLPISFDVSGFYERLEFVNASTLDQGREPLFIERTGGASIGAFLPLNRARYTIAARTRVGLLYSFTSTNLADALLMSGGSVSS